MTNGASNDIRGLDKALTRTERQLLNTRSTEKIVLTQISISKTVNPTRIYAREISRRVEALRQANGLSAPIVSFNEHKLCSTSQQIQAVELVKQWSASYFLPMLCCTKKLQNDTKGDGKGNEDGEVGDVSSLRCLSRPKKGLRLPLVFKKGKKLDLAR